MDDALTVQDVLNIRWAKLTDLAGKLGLSPADLVAAYIDFGMRRAAWRYTGYLYEIEDHSRITGWQPDGTPILKD